MVQVTVALSSSNSNKNSHTYIQGTSHSFTICHCIHWSEKPPKSDMLPPFKIYCAFSTSLFLPDRQEKSNITQKVAGQGCMGVVKMEQITTHPPEDSGNPCDLCGWMLPRSCMWLSLEPLLDVLNREKFQPFSPHKLSTLQYGKKLPKKRMNVLRCHQQQNFWSFFNTSSISTHSNTHYSPSIFSHETVTHITTTITTT